MTKPPIDSRKSSNSVICPQCGTPMPTYAIFCGFCGERIKKQEVTTVNSVVSTEQIKGKPSEPAKIPHTVPAVIGTRSNAWGWLPVLSLTSATGVLLEALAANAGRFG